MKIGTRQLFIISLGIIVLIGPMLDLVTGYVQQMISLSDSITPGILYRGMILTPIFAILTLNTKTPSRFIFWYFVYISILALLVHLLMKSGYNPFADVNRLLKILFPILGLGAFLYLEKRVFKDSIREDYLWISGGLYGLIIVVMVLIFYFVGLAIPAYRHQSFSSKAFYDGQNAVGLVMTMSLPLFLSYIYSYRKTKLFFSLILSGVYLLGAILLGSRAAIIGVTLGIILFYLSIIILRKSKRRYLKLFYNLVLLIGLLLVGYLVYQFWITQDITYTLRKFDLLISGQFRNRVPDGLRTISGFTILEHLFGLGEKGFSLTENDLVDIYGKFGLLILIPLLLFFLTYYIGIWRVFLETRSIRVFCLFLALSFYIGHASVAGHGFATAQVNNLMILVYYLAYREIKAYHQTKVANEEISSSPGWNPATSTR
jgi:hypothetical protein